MTEGTRTYHITTIFGLITVFSVLLAGCPTAQNVSSAVTARFHQPQSSSATNKAIPKAWIAGGANMSVDGMFVHMSKDYDDRKQPNAFHAFVRDQRSGWSASFRGACGPLMPINAQAVYTSYADMRPVLSTGRGADLPPLALKLVRALRVALQDQCPELQVIPLRLETNYRVQNPGALTNFLYDGTLTAANGWHLKDGLESTPYDGERIVRIQLRDAFSVVGISFEGRCEKQPLLELGPQFHNQQEATFHRSPRLDDYARMADTATERYRRECPGVEAIRFSVAPLPDNYGCAPQSDCAIHASAQSGWKPDTSKIAYVHPKPAAIQSFVDILNFLGNGDLSTVRKQPKYFRTFYEGFIAAYSDHCRERLRNPVPRSFVLVTNEYDGHGNLLSEEHSAPSRTVFVEREYALKYDQFSPVNRTYKSALLLSGSMKGRSPVQMVGQWISDHKNLEQRIVGRCFDPDLQTAYRNMHKIAQEM